MNWYKLIKFSHFLKTASVTFSINDSHRISQPKDLMKLCQDLSIFIHYKAKMIDENFYPLNTDIDPDTSHSDFEGYTGTINFYVRPNEKSKNSDMNRYIEAINAWIEDKKLEGYVIKLNNIPEKSRYVSYSCL